jgi:class 3 adenylate cyclase
MYDRRKLKEILRIYGKKLSRFRELYDNFVAEKIDKVSAILWEKEPLPITVLNFYKGLEIIYNSIIVERRHSLQRTQATFQQEEPLLLLDVVSEAKRLLGRTDFYGHQFRRINSDSSRRQDANFLYSLKLCYELGSGRTSATIEEFQRNIFGNFSVSDPLRTLSSWIYLSGQHYSMHDSCKEAIKFDESAKLKIVTYLVDNFSNLVSSLTDGDVQIYLLGRFIGKNVSLIPYDKTRKFLPAKIYDFAKTNRHFEEGLGHGIGEVFVTLDDSLQEMILKRVEVDIQFAQALGDSLGMDFEHLLDDYKKHILSKVGKSIIFARYFGQSMGRALFHLPKDVQEEIFLEVKRNPQFSDGVGIGIGYIFKFLNEAMKREVLTRSSTDPDLRRGLGCGYGQNYLSLEQAVQAEIRQQIELDDKLGQGFGLGIGHTFGHLPKELQIQAISWSNNNEHFAYGLGTGIGYRFNYLNRYVQRDVLSKHIEENLELAQGLGLGIGVIFAYLDKELREEILKKARENPRLMIGLGCGHGLRFVYLLGEDRTEVFAKADKEPLFAKGLGWGLGYTWVYLDKTARDDILGRIDRNPNLAKGLGWGMGSTFVHHDIDFRAKILQLAEDNSGFANGLGFGIGAVINFVDSDIIDLAYHIAENNCSFAEGLGYGQGFIFKFLSDEMKQDVFVRAERNPAIERGLGLGLGRIFTFLPADLRSYILEKMETHPLLSEGMASNLSFIFTQHLAEDLKREVLILTSKNSSFARGLGTGLGIIFNFIPSERQNDILSRAQENLQLAIGLGGGLGYAYASLSEALKGEILEEMLQVPEGGFAKGFGIGLGRILPFLRYELREQILRKSTTEDSQFAIGLGVGVGTILGYLRGRMYDGIIQRLEGISNAKFSAGIGEGFGLTFNYQNKIIRDEILGKIDGNPNLAKGLGWGLGSIFSYLVATSEYGRNNRKVIESLIQNYPQFALGFGAGMGSVSCSDFERDRTNFIVSYQHSSCYNYGLGYGLAYSFRYSSRELRMYILERMQNNQFLSQGFGLGLGQIFYSLDATSKEGTISLLINERRNEELSYGLGVGLGQNFRYLDDTVQGRLLGWADQISEFAKGLAWILAYKFPSLNHTTQTLVLRTVTNNVTFAKSFGHNLEHACPYLSRDLLQYLETITTMVERDDKEERPSSSVQAADNSVTRDQISLDIDFPSVSGIRMKEEGFNTLFESPLDPSNEVFFSGNLEPYCVCFIDIVNSTDIAAGLAERQIGRYYAIFLNSMATIAKHFGGKIVKNAGDSLIIYFPETSNPSKESAFRNLFECLLTMVDAHRDINAKLSIDKLPALNYRISADYGILERVRSASLQGDDLFGSTMNICAKINSKADNNGIVIGDNLYKTINGLPLVNSYSFTVVAAHPILGKPYPVYAVKSVEPRPIVNPFSRGSDVTSHSTGYGRSNSQKPFGFYTPLNL